MAEGNNHIKIYTPEQIQSYLEGKMTAGEMHELERAALEDPFLADAIEGYSVSGTSPVISQGQLKEALRDRLTGRNRTLPGWLKIAAAIAILVTTVVSITLIINPGGRSDSILASQKEPARLKDSAVRESETVSRESEDSASTETANRPALSKADRKMPAVSEDTKEVSPPVPSIEKSEDASAPVAIADEAVPEKSISSQLQGKVSGIVIDSNKRPVPGAVVTTMAKQQVVTDDSGLFALKPTDTAMNVEVQSVGFAKRNAVVKNDSVLDTIVLSPSSPRLDEVVVVGYGTKKARRPNNRKAKEIIAVAEPSTTWEEYNSYLNNNLRSSGLDTIPGEAVISFTVNADGSLSKFRVEKAAPTKRVTEFIIDLIKKGPKWQVADDTIGRGTVKIQLGKGS